MNFANKTSIPDLYLRVVESMPYGIIISDSAGNSIFWNEKASFIMKAAEDAIQQKDWVHQFGVFNLDKTTMYTTEDLPMSKALRGEYIADEKLYIHNKDLPEGVYLKISAFPIIENEQISAAVVLFDDITKEQQLYDNIIGQINGLTSYLKQLDTLKTVYSHENQSKKLPKKELA